MSLHIRYLQGLCKQLGCEYTPRQVAQLLYLKELQASGTIDETTYWQKKVDIYRKKI